MEEEEREVLAPTSLGRSFRLSGFACLAAAAELNGLAGGMIRFNHRAPPSQSKYIKDLRASLSKGKKGRW